MEKPSRFRRRTSRRTPIRSLGLNPHVERFSGPAAGPSEFQSPRDYPHQPGFSPSSPSNIHDYERTYGYDAREYPTGGGAAETGDFREQFRAHAALPSQEESFSIDNSRVQFPRLSRDRVPLSAFRNQFLEEEEFIQSSDSFKEGEIIEEDFATARMDRDSRSRRYEQIESRHEKIT